MSNTTSSASVLRDNVLTDLERMWQYKRLAVALTYPDARLAVFFPDLTYDADQLALEYDRLFRARDIWLYSAEYLARNEFERVQLLADVAGFYRAFGVASSHDRPDALACEFEFMHYLIYKQLYAQEHHALADKVELCFDAQRKFFTEHLYPAASQAARAIAAHSDNAFYQHVAAEMLAFLEAEATRLGEEYREQGDAQ